MNTSHASSSTHEMTAVSHARNSHAILDMRYLMSLREIKNDLVMDILESRRPRTLKDTLLTMMSSGELDFNAFREAIRVTSTQKTNSSMNDSLDDQYSQGDLISALDQRRNEIIEKIESLINKVLQDIVCGNNPKLVLRNQKLWSNCLFEDRITLKNISVSQMTTVSFASPTSREKFCLILHLLSTIQQMMMKKCTSTRRELYYQNKDKIKSQVAIDSAIRDVCCLLQVPPWEMGVLATSKGLIAGPVTLKSSSGAVISCMGAGGILIPQDVLSFTNIESEAMFILVIEKDAIFQKLLDEGALERLGPCIFITGKGYPDINTRLMLKLLVDTLRIPSFALVDADPHGIEIMCTYRFGSLAMSHLSDRLAVPSMLWLGIHPTDITSLSAPSLPLSSRDGAKIRDISARPYTLTNPALQNQLEVLLKNEVKCEIEGVATMSQAYLTDRYISHKICAKDLI